MKRKARRRRRLLAGGLAVAVGLAVGLGVGAFGAFDDLFQELTLPLRHEDIIRQQAADKGVDASLIAGVIYAESRFRDQTSKAGARGLMQVTPATANEVERKSGGTEFRLADLADPDINIRYGTFYLELMLDRFGGNEVAALAAYNAGPTKAEGWGGTMLTLDAIPLVETQGYVADVLEKRREYRDRYARELGY
jgi:soluble lytic murein transglycosylase